MEYKAKSLRRRRNTDKWECVLCHAHPITGEEVMSYHTLIAKTRKQAEQARCELIVKLEMEGFSVSTDMTVLQYMDYFLDYKQASKTIEPSTIKGYECDKRMMCKYIGSETLSDLTIAKIDQWMAAMCKDGYSPKTVTKCFILLKQTLNNAIKEGLINKNPCNFCKPPKRFKTPINALNREERSRMLELARRAQPNALAVAIEIMLTTGMRRGEVCALRWSDFDEAKRTLSVTHSLGNGKGGFYLKEPKTGKSRVIPLTEHTFNLLVRMRDDVSWMCGKLKIPVTNTFILGTLETESKPYNPTQLTKEFGAFCKMNGFECSAHDLRHTFATYLIAAGVDIITVSNYLGHANPSMTLDIYADVDPEAKMQAVSRIEEAFDDADSVLRREIRQRRAEIEEAGVQPSSDPDKASSISADSIPFSIEELEAMLATLKAAS